jgi:hypothetical protein
MGIERAPQLDIDNPTAVDAHPVFFQPFPDTPDFRRAVAEQLREYCESWGDHQWWYHCPDELLYTDRVSCALHVIDRLASWVIMRSPFTICIPLMSRSGTGVRK